MANTTIAETGKETVRAKSRPLSPLVPLFMICLVLPIFFFIGPLRLSPYRLVVFASFAPLVLTWIAGMAGRVILPDVLILFSCTWGALAFAIAHGFPGSIELMGVVIMQCYGPYLIARHFIRSKSQFRTMVKLQLGLIMMLLPFAIYESQTGQPLYLNLFRSLAPTYANVIMEARLGLDRSQGAFEHPILYGIFCSTGFAMAYFCLFKNRSNPVKFVMPGLVGLATFLSLSTGAIVSIAIQLGLIAWDYLTKFKTRWKVLAMIVVGAYFTVDLLSNRSPVDVFISYLTFNTGSAYNRVLIWHYGTAEVMRHPFFGIGFNEWERAHWMSTSMDNFWLVIAVTNGLPAFLSLAGGILIICMRIGAAEHDDEEIHRYRYGLLVTLVGVFVAICSVHLWNATFCWLMFLIGSGVWIFNEKPPGAPKAAAEDRPLPGSDPRRSSRPTGPLIGGEARHPTRAATPSPFATSRKSGR